MSRRKRRWRETSRRKRRRHETDRQCDKEAEARDDKEEVER